MSDETHEPGYTNTRLRRSGRAAGARTNAGDTTAEEQAFLMGEAPEPTQEVKPEQKSDE